MVWDVEADTASVEQGCLRSRTSDNYGVTLVFIFSELSEGKLSLYPDINEGL